MTPQDVLYLRATHSNAVREPKGIQTSYWPFCYTQERQLFSPWKLKQQKTPENKYKESCQTWLTHNNLFTHAFC